MTITTKQTHVQPADSQAPSHAPRPSYQAVNLVTETREALGVEIYREGRNLCLRPEECSHDATVVRGCGRECNYCRSIGSRVGVSMKLFDTMCCFNFNSDWNCNTKNVIYCIECECKKQYIGMTSRSARERWNEHKRQINFWRNNDPRKLHQVFYSHFSTTSCNHENLRWQILEKIPYNGDKSTNTVLLKEREAFYIRLINSAIPNGWNNDIYGYGHATITSNYCTERLHPYFNLREKRRDRPHGKKKKHKNCTDRDILARNPFQNRIKLAKLMRFTDQGLMYQVLCNKKDQQKLTKKLPILKIPHIHPVMSNGPISRWIKKEIEKMTDKKYRTIFCLEDTIGKNLFNYNSLARNTEKDELVRKMQATDCCQNIDEKYKILGHVYTTDGNVIDGRWGQLLEKGAKFRPVSHNLSYLKEKLIKELKKNNDKIWESINEENKKKLEKSIDKIFTDYYNKNDLRKWKEHWSPSREEIKRIHSRFTLVPLDKASNNISIICTNKYAQLISKNFGLKIENGNLRFESTGEYEMKDITMDEILLKQVQIYHTLGIQPPPSDTCRLPNVYGTPKWHKFPRDPTSITVCKMRYITSGCRAYTKEADTILKHLISHLANHFAARNKYNAKYFGAKNLKSPVIASSEEAIKFINETNMRHNPKRILSLDVSGMFSNMLHSTIINDIEWLCNRMLTGRNSYITIENGYTRYVSDSYTGKKWGKNEIMNCLKNFLTNFYTDYCGFMFRTARGYAMGSSSAPAATSASLSVQEFKYFQQPTVSLNIGFRRYCDDIFFCGEENIEIISKLIYSNEIVLERDPEETGSQVNFLDLSIWIENNRLEFKSFDKRDLFKFKAKKLIDGDSNIPDSIKKSIVYSEVLRLIKRNSTIEGYTAAMRKLRETCNENNLEFDLPRIFNKILSRQASDLLKYRVTIETIIKEILQ